MTGLSADSTVCTVTVQDRSPEMSAFLARVAARPPAAAGTSTLDKLRFPDPPRARAIGTTEGPVTHVADSVTAPDGHRVALHWYVPTAADRLIVYVHGGGWVSGDRVMLEPFARQLADATGSVVAFIEYRLAPEHPYPTVLADVEAGVVHAVRNWTGGRAPGSGTGGVHLLGDSAGGQLTVAALAGVAERHPALLDAVESTVLVYPALDPTMSSASYRDQAEAPTLTSRDMEYSWDVVLRDAGDPADLNGCRLLDRVHDERPIPTLVVTTGRDPLHDEGRDLARRIADRGGTVRYIDYPDSPHGILWMAGILPAGRDLLRRVRDFMDHGAPPPGAENDTTTTLR